jgi:hypothetical protein
MATIPLLWSSVSFSDIDAKLRIVSLPDSVLAQDIYACSGGVPGFIKDHIQPMVFLLVRVASRNYTVCDTIPAFEGDEHVVFCAWIGILIKHFVRPEACAFPSIALIQSQEILHRTMLHVRASSRSGILAFAQFDDSLPGSALLFLRATFHLHGYMQRTSSDPFLLRALPSFFDPLFSEAKESASKSAHGSGSSQLSSSAFSFGRDLRDMRDMRELRMKFE